MNTHGLTPFFIGLFVITLTLNTRLVVQGRRRGQPWRVLRWGVGGAVLAAVMLVFEIFLLLHQP